MKSRRNCSVAWHGSFCEMTTDSVRCWAIGAGSKVIHTSRTTCFSTNIFTAIVAEESVHRTRLGGPDSSQNYFSLGRKSCEPNRNHKSNLLENLYDRTNGT